MENQKSAIGLDGNITAAIGYIIGLLALVLIFIEKENKFVRFHALQSILWVAAATIGFLVIMVVGLILGFGVAMVSETLAWIVGAIFILLYVGCFVALFGGLIYGAVKSYGGSMTKLPFVGNLAEKWNN